MKNRPKKNLGQNFLIDENVLQKIIEAAEIKKSDRIIEIGPGLGTLTEELLKHAKTIISIEIDEKLVPILIENLKDTLSKLNGSTLTILNQDALKYEPPNKPYKLVANIPYYITSPLITHFLKSTNPPKTLTLLTQKEVAEKICEKETYSSILSLQIALYGQATLIQKVSKDCFLPAPKVDSAIIHIKPRKTPTKNAEKIIKTAKKAFSQKRKKLSNTLPELKDKLEKLNLAEKRPQHLTIADWQSLV